MKQVQRQQRYILALIVVSVVFFVGESVFALQTGVATGQLDSAGAATGLTNADPRVFVATMLQALLGIMGTIFAGLILYAGYLFLIARGRSDFIENAKKTMLRAVVGLIIVLASYSITTFIKNSMSMLQDGGPQIIQGSGGTDIHRCCFACNRTDSSGICNKDTLLQFEAGNNRSRVTWIQLYVMPNSSRACRDLPAQLKAAGECGTGDDRCVVNEITDPRCSAALPLPRP